MDALIGLCTFGSTARGDPDDSSDIDILAVYAEPPSEEFRRKVQQKLINVLGKRVALAEYTVDRLNTMFSEGHMFAWHLYHEAKPLSVSELHVIGSYKFLCPAPYKEGIADANRFIELLRSVTSEVSKGTCSEIHEAGISYLCLRNIAMALSFVASDKPNFTRYSPLELSQELGIRPPCSQEFYEKLIKARHASQRGFAAPVVQLDEFHTALASSLEWTELIMEKVNGKP